MQSEDSVQKREPETVEELFEALESPLLSYALRLTQDTGVAQDITQEAFMRLHAQYSNVREPRRWLYRTVHNLALNHCRAQKKVVPLAPDADHQGCHTEPIESLDPQPLPDEQISRLEGIGLVRLSLKALDERSRELISLKFQEDLSYREISQRTGLTTGHVGYLLHHALKAVADELANNGVCQ
jgi:RNA polymerase sigma-70 factor (ECF subfamily)